MTHKFFRITILGLALLFAACGSVEEPTPLPEVVATTVATEAIATETAVPATATSIPPTDTPIPATATPEPADDELVATNTPETAVAEDTPAAVSVTGIDSGIIAYTSMGETVDLFALVPGQAPVQMSYGQGLSYGASWSPSGQRIAYFYLDALSGQTDFWYFDITTGPQPVPITSDGTAGSVARLNWSADSEFLVYDAPQPDGAESDVYRVSVATGEIINLTEGSAARDASPDWSPDGQRIAFVSDRAEADQGSQNIWLMDSEGGQLQQLTNSDAAMQEDIEPAWSPDSSQIAFIRYLAAERAGEPASPSGLWLIDVVSGEETLLVEMAGSLAEVQVPVWSPDGRWLAYNAPGLADMDIWVVSVEGGEPISVGNLPGEDANISWSPSSQELIFTNSTDGNMSQFIVAADGSGLSLLVETGQNGLGSWSP